MEFKPHSDKQEDAIFSTSRITLAATGIQWGKTSVGALRTKIKIHQYTAEDDAFIITAPTYKIMKQSTLPAFLKLMKGYGKYNKTDAQFEVYNGGIVYFRTETDPDSVVGITNVRHIWGDEAGKYSLYFWENLQGRAAFGECNIDLTTSPYSLNWIFKDLIRPHMKNPFSSEEFKYIKASSMENPYFPLAEYERQRGKMDERRFRMMFGGEWERMEGLVYDCYEPKENICEWPSKGQGEKVFAGVDWGFTEPFAMCPIAIYPNGERKQLTEVKKARLTLNQIIDVCREKMTTFEIKHFFCGPDQPGYIQALNEAGIPASAADNAVKIGIAKVYEFIKSRKLQFVDGQCTHTLDELETYHYPDPKDIRPDRDIKEDAPVKQNDHMLDALRYCIMSTLGSENARAPRQPGDAPTALTQQQRIARLHKKKVQT